MAKHGLQGGAFKKGTTPKAATVRSRRSSFHPEQHGEKRAPRLSLHEGHDARGAATVGQRRPAPAYEDASNRPASNIARAPTKSTQPRKGEGGVDASGPVHPRTGDGWPSGPPIPPENSPPDTPPCHLTMAPAAARREATNGSPPNHRPKARSQPAPAAKSTHRKSHPAPLAAVQGPEQGSHDWRTARAHHQHACPPRARPPRAARSSGSTRARRRGAARRPRPPYRQIWPSPDLAATAATSASRPVQPTAPPPSPRYPAARACASAPRTSAKHRRPPPPHANSLRAG
nr:mucin-1-like [Aegilops tauschii subsp. strangulata]